MGFLQQLHLCICSSKKKYVGLSWGHDIEPFIISSYKYSLGTYVFDRNLLKEYIYFFLSNKTEKALAVS